MAQQAIATSANVQEGYWLWDDPDHGGYTKFDDDTSKQVEDRLKEAIAKKTKGPIEVQLSAGPWFGLAKNKGIYSCVIIVDCTDPSNPVINQARQTNTNSGFKRPIKRYPPLDPPLEEHLQIILDALDGKWEWKDDSGWKEYDLETMQQIESGYQENKALVELSKGKWFGKPSNKGVYYIEYNYYSVPCSAQQHNKKSHYGRWVRRIPTKQIEEKQELTKQEKFFLKSDKHFLWRKSYFPLSRHDFDEQKNDDNLKQNLKCSICMEDFAEKDLLETQKPDKVKKTEINEDEEKKKQSSDNKKNDDKNAGKVHKYDLTKSNRFVKDATIVGLKNCAYGHYFHADCILPALNNQKKCPNCQYAYGKIIGHQPEGRLYLTLTRAKCSGFDNTKNSIKLLFEFPGGIQGAHHPNPGKIYFGDLREAFLPNNKEGREAAMLTRLAFKRRLIFSIGTSLTLNQDNRIVFGSLHLKTATSGGQQKHGWPDDGYFDRFTNDLKQKGITLDQLSDLEKKFVQSGFPKNSH